MTMTTEDAGQGAGPLRLEVQNNSTIGQFLWIGFYSSIFTLLTLTLFRFWARTIVRKRLWADTTIGGTPLEYTGKGSELFVGFLIAIVTVMVPSVGAIVAAQLLLQNPVYVAIVIAAIYLGFFILIGVALFLARRYQLSRTNWRGVRFEQRGSPWAYGLIAFGYGLLSAITLGWFAPAMRLRLEKRMWNNAFFGDMAFTYDNSNEARTEPVYKSYILAYVGVILYYALIIGGMFQLGLMESIGAGGVPDMRDIGILYALIFGGAILFLMFVAWHEAVMIRQITKSISLGDVKLKSTISTWDLIGLVFTNLLLVVFTLGFGGLAAQMRTWRKICRRIEVDGTLDAARIHQAASRGPRSGEGMADAFDLSGGV